MEEMKNPDSNFTIAKYLTNQFTNWNDWGIAKDMISPDWSGWPSTGWDKNASFNEYMRFRSEYDSTTASDVTSTGSATPKISDLTPQQRQSLLGGVSWGKAYATGGHISGPGGPRTDSIPAMLSDGEYVINASAVDAYGVEFMNMINSGQYANGGFIRGFEAGGAAEYRAQDVAMAHRAAARNARIYSARGEDDRRSRRPNSWGTGHGGGGGRWGMAVQKPGGGGGSAGLGYNPVHNEMSHDAAKDFDTASIIKDEFQNRVAQIIELSLQKLPDLFSRSIGMSQPWMHLADGGMVRSPRISFSRPMSRIDSNVSNPHIAANYENKNIAYNVNVNVAGTNSSPEEIARVVMSTLKRKEQATTTQRRMG